jgi:hypothetical protein
MKTTYLQAKTKKQTKENEPAQAKAMIYTSLY